MMDLIKFNKEFYDDILSGRKTQTIRRNNKRLSAFDIVKAIFPGTNYELTLKITGSGYKQFKSLDIEDAKREGYETLEELKEVLTSIYPTIDKFDRIYYYQFEVVDTDDV